MIVSFNFYYAQPGLEDAVLRQRLRACEVRESIGIPRGRVLQRTQGAHALPDVIWEHRFDDVAGHHADMAVRAASPEFESVRAGMRKLCRRFERPLFEICGGAPADEAVQPFSVVTLDWFFCASDQGAQSLAVVDEQALRRAQQGNGGQLLRLITPGSDLPEIVWRQDYADAASHELKARIASSSRPQIDALTQHVEHSVWKVA